MSDGLKVNRIELQNAAADMETTVGNMTKALESLDQEIGPKVATWEGSQKDAYQVAKTTWNNTLNEMLKLLGEAKTSVLNSSDEYAAADKRGAGRFEF